MSKKISYYSLGCKVNLYESEAVINQFIDNGFSLVKFGEESDVCIINTCTVTQTSDSKSRKIIRQAVNYNPNAVICVMGCYSQLNQEEALSIEGVDIVTGTSNRLKIYEEVMKILEKNELKENFNKVNLTQKYEEINCYENVSLTRFNDRTRGFVKVQDGCENFCSYCTIPFSRGKLRSRKAEDIINEINVLTKSGMKEIVLTGINTGAYGKELSDYSFADLLSDICSKVENLGRIRISSIEATEVTDELLDIIKENKDHFCDHFHIPLQGGCDNTLKRMNRKYDMDYYFKKISKIREVFPLANITTDCLAGFNGETKEDFLESLENIKKIGFGEMHVFPYSPRIRTAAYKLPNLIDGVTKKFRVNELLKLNEINAIKYREQFLGKVVDCLVEKNNKGTCFGHSSNYLEISFEDKSAKENELINVRITEVNYPVCKGVRI